MSCRHSLANTTCSRCYPNATGLDSNGRPQVDPGPEEDYEPNLDGPGAVPAAPAPLVVSDKRRRLVDAFADACTNEATAAQVRTRDVLLNCIAELEHDNATLTRWNDEKNKREEALRAEVIRLNDCNGARIDYIAKLSRAVGAGPELTDDELIRHAEHLRNVASQPPGIEYRESFALDEVNLLAADGWRVQLCTPCYDYTHQEGGNVCTQLCYLLARERRA